MNRRTWRRYDGQFISATILLEEPSNNHSYQIFPIVNFRTLGIYIRKSFDIFSETIKEIAIDAKYGTNNAGIQLFAVLAEFDGTGVALAYLFVEKNIPSGFTFPDTLT